MVLRAPLCGANCSVIAYRVHSFSTSCFSQTGLLTVRIFFYPQTRRIERWRGGKGVPILTSWSRSYFTTVADVFISRRLIGATFVSCEGTC
jgi:hypothetical protein